MVMLFASIILFQLRTKKLIVFNPFRLVSQYTEKEKKLMLIGAMATLTGLISLRITEHFVGFYYFKNGVLTLFTR